jgi:hypothetical protein
MGRLQSPALFYGNRCALGTNRADGLMHSQLHDGLKDIDSFEVP